MHGYDDIRLKKVLLLGALCAGLVRVAVAQGTDYSYQALTNLGYGVSSRILLMNNDTNETCPIRCQGYYDTNETTTAVGDTFWWHILILCVSASLLTLIVILWIRKKE